MNKPDTCDTHTIKILVQVDSYNKLACLPCFLVQVIFWYKLLTANRM